jgi:hypothetical protein
MSHMMRHTKSVHASLRLMSASAKDQELPVLVIVADDMSAAFVSGSTTALAEEDRLVAGGGGGVSHAGKLKSMLMLGMLWPANESGHIDASQLMVVGMLHDTSQNAQSRSVHVKGLALKPE